jgi:hypothetical protein
MHLSQNQLLSPVSGFLSGRGQSRVLATEEYQNHFPQVRKFRYRALEWSYSQLSWNFPLFCIQEEQKLAHREEIFHRNRSRNLQENTVSRHLAQEVVLKDLLQKYRKFYLR